MTPFHEAPKAVSEISPERKLVLVIFLVIGVPEGSSITANKSSPADVVSAGNPVKSTSAISITS